MLMILVALVPALMWGNQGVISTKLGGSPAKQTLGITYGALIFALILTVVHHVAIPGRVWWVGIAAGACWTWGNFQQFNALRDMGVSKAYPLSCAMQLIVNAAVAALFFQEWHTPQKVMWGIIAVVLVAVGGLFVSFRDRQVRGPEQSGNTAAGWRALALSTLGFGVYSTIPKFYQHAQLGQVDAATLQAQMSWGLLLPEAIGMVLAGLLFARLVAKEVGDYKHKYTLKNTLTGLAWALGNLCMLIASMSALGLATAYTMSQMSSAVAAVGGVWLLHESKTHREKWGMICGVILVILGGVIIANV